MRRYFATSTKAWRAERARDHYANNCVRSRAEFKLSELQDKFGILRRGQNVVDLGAAPGGFSLVAARVIRLRDRHPTLSSWKVPVRPGDTVEKTQITRSFGGHQRRRGYGRLVCVDMNEMDEIEGDARFVRGDVRDEATHAAMVRALNCEEADVVLSDIAPRTATDVETSHFRSVELARAALAAADAVLRSGGAMVVKIFAGAEEAQFRGEMRERFVKVRAYKPKASKKRSVEHYLIGDGFVPSELRAGDEVGRGGGDDDIRGSCNVPVGLAQVILARDDIIR